MPQHTVLVVDDVQTDRELLGRVIEKAGHKVVTAADGEEGMAQAKAHRPALIFLDVIMPKVSGFQVCRALKTDPATAKIPVVIVTSKNGDSDKFWGERQGADEYLVKPFSPAEMERVMKKYLSV